MQDVIEELIGTEIVDETDQFVDNLRSEKVNLILKIANEDKTNTVRSYICFAIISCFFSSLPINTSRHQETFRS